MSAESLDGRRLADSLKPGLAAALEELRAAGDGLGLATLGFAGDEAAAGYGRRLRALADELGLPLHAVVIGADASTADAVGAIEELNGRSDVGGILVFMPPPPQVDANALVEAIDPRKDVDGAHPLNAAALYLGGEAPVPATARAVLELLRGYEVPLSGRHAVVIGRSAVIGKPLAMLLLGADATVTVCHSRTPDLAAHTRGADLVVAAVGSPGLVTAEMIDEGTVVVDVGTNYVDGSLVGDVAPEVGERAAMLSPVPGGVGPLTNLMLVSNLLDLIRSR